MRAIQLSLWAFAILLASTGVARAACLNGSFTVDQEYARSDFVFVAFVTKGEVVRSPDDPDGFIGTEYVVEPLAVFKGNPPPELMLYSENTSGRFPMQLTGTYLVFVGPAAVFDGHAPARMIDYCGFSFGLTGLSSAFGPEVPRAPLSRLLAYSPDIDEFVAQAEGCAHFAGEEGYDSHRAGELERAVSQLRCHEVSETGAYLQGRYTGQGEALERINAALAPFQD